MSMANTRAALFERATQMLYGTAAGSKAGGGTMNWVDNSFWQPRIREAAGRGDILKAKRLESERREFFEAAKELDLSPDQARRLSVVLRDTASRPTKRERLTESDELRLQQRHGENVQQLVQTGYARLGEALKTRPALLAAATAGGAWAHGEIADVAAELAAAAPPAPVTPSPEPPPKAA